MIAKYWNYLSNKKSHTEAAESFILEKLVRPEHNYKIYQALKNLRN